MPKVTKKPTKARTRTLAKKSTKGLFQRTSPLSILKDNKLAITLAVLIAAGSFGGYKYYQRENASAYTSELCGQDGGTPCWKLWTDLGITKDPNGVELQGHACIRPMTFASPSGSGEYLIARVWSTRDAPPKGYYGIYIAFGPLDLVTNFSSSAVQKKIVQSIYYSPQSNPKSGSQSVVLYEPLVNGDGKIGIVSNKDPGTGKDNYVIYGYRLEGGYYGAQSKPISVATIKKISCYGGGSNTTTGSPNETTNPVPEAAVSSSLYGSSNENSSAPSSTQKNQTESSRKSSSRSTSDSSSTPNSTTPSEADETLDGAYPPEEPTQTNSQQKKTFVDILLSPWRWVLRVVGLSNN